MTEPKSVFFIGITGFIGGSVFTSLRDKYPSFTYTALVRNPEHFSAVQAAGATPILGTFSNHDIIAKHVSEADITLNCANADAVDLNEAVLDGMKRRRTQGKTVGVLVHISGTAVFCDWRKEGKFDEQVKQWSDGNVDDIKSITMKMLHGQVDVPIFQASLAGDVHSYIVAPSAVHGPGTGPVGRTSALIKFFGGEYVKRGEAFVVGEGTNVLGFVHIADLVSLFLLVLDHALAFYPNPPPTTPYERYYIANTRHLAWNTIAAHFAKALYKRGKILSAEVKRIAPEGDDLVNLVFSSNLYTTEVRGPALGWMRSGSPPEETLDGDFEAFYPL